MKVLIVSKCPTHPITAGNRFLIQAQADMLRSLGCDVHFLYVYDAPLRNSAKSYTKALSETKKVWGEKFHFYEVPKWEKIIFNLRNLYRKKFCHNFVKCDDEYPMGLTSYVEKLNKDLCFDAVIINYYYLSKLLKETCIIKKAVLTHDCFTYRASFAGALDKQLKPNEESKAMRRCANIFAVQDEESAYFKRIAPSSRVYVTYANYEYKPTPVTHNKNILFFSGGNDYNVNGVRWFIDEVFPLICKEIPEAKLLIGGSICNVIKDAYQGKDNIVLYGYVDDPVEFYSQGDVAINPVFQGTGIKIKTFEAISYDKVVMVHPHSGEGIYAKESAPLFYSKEPEGWVEFLKRLWTDESTIQDIKNKNKEYIASLNSFVSEEYKRFLETK